MEIKFESMNPEDLRELQQLIYQKHPEIEVNEAYKESPGVQTEPIVVAIIVSLGGPAIVAAVKDIVSEYLRHKREKDLNKMKHREELLKISLQSENKSWELVSQDEFMNMKFKKE